MREERRIPGLDGLRAASILFVVFGHARTSEGWPAAFGSEIWGDLAGTGVLIFFVLSGFLITSLLLAEEAKTGRVDLPNFYWRRALRILPAATTYLIALAVLGLAWHPVATWRELLASAAFVRNLYRSGSDATEHYWSLAIEEQFYLVWPAVFLLLPPKRRLTFVGIALAFCPVWLHIWTKLQAHVHVNFWRADLRAIGPLTGCALALWRERPSGRNAFEMLLRGRGAVAFWLALPTLASLLVATQYPMSGGLRVAVLPGECGAIAVMIAAAGTAPGAIASRILNAAPVQFVGRLSYSLYLWQQLFLVRPGHVWFGQFPLNVALAATAAYASYRFVEQPILSWRRKRTAPGSPSVDLGSSKIEAAG